MSERQFASTKHWVLIQFPHEKVYNLEVCGVSFMKHCACTHISYIATYSDVAIQTEIHKMNFFEEIILYNYVTVPVSMSAMPNSHYYHQIS